jgi:hypothetical protein
MSSQVQPRKALSAMLRRVTGELLHLMDGLYSNIEDGLFELAYRTDHEAQRRRCFDLMRDMRFQRSRIVQTFARRMQSGFDAWLTDAALDEACPAAQEALARRMAQKCTSHFGGLLQAIAERSSDALGRETGCAELPISPYRVAGTFIESLRALKFDDQAIDIVENLFSRFVLERLGPVYGECNQQLEQSGFYTSEELTELSRARA